MPDTLEALKGLTRDVRAVDRYTKQFKNPDGLTGKKRSEYEAGLTEAEDRAEEGLALLSTLSGRGWFVNTECLGLSTETTFYPSRGAPTRPAKDICRDCSARLDCGVVGIVRNEKFGIWGGLSERERRRIRKQYRAWCKSEGLEPIKIEAVRVLNIRIKQTNPAVENLVGDDLADDEGDGTEDAKAFAIHFNGAVERKQLDLVRQLLRYGPKGLHLPKGDVSPLALMLDVGVEALVTQRLQPLINGKLVAWLGGDEDSCLVVTKHGERWFEHSGLKRLPALSQPSPDRQVEVPTATPRRGVVVSTPVPMPVTPLATKREEEDMVDRIDSHEELNRADLEILKALAEKDYLDDSGRAGALLAADTGLAATYQNARMRLLEDADLVIRELNGKRTKLIAITDEGREWLRLATDNDAADESGPAASGFEPDDAASGDSTTTSVVEPLRNEAGMSLADLLTEAVVLGAKSDRQLAAVTAERDTALASLAEVTAERDELKAADELRKQRLAELQAERERIEAEISAES